MPELLPHKAVKAKAGILKDTVDRFCEEYRWTEPGLYRGDVKESEKVSGGGVSNPTKNVAIGEIHLNRRQLVKSALRQLDEAQLCLNSAIGLLNDAQPKFKPTEKVLSANPDEGIYGPVNVTPTTQTKEGNRYVKHWGAWKEQREARGGGYGES